MKLEPATTSFSERKVLRRGLLAGIAGLGTAAMMKLTGASKAVPAEAAASPLLFPAAQADPETVNTSYKRTNLVAAATFSGTWVYYVDGHSAPVGVVGIYGSGGVGADGVQGAGGASSGQGGRGVYALGGAVTGGNAGVGIEAQGGSASNTLGGDGVYAFGGESTNNKSGRGVAGFSTSNMGVYGQSTSSDGVHGKSTSGIGVQGESQSAYGVSGICFGSSVGVFGGAVNGAGVWGQSNSYVGVYGNSLGNATGVYGVSQGSGSGVFGDSANGIGIYAIGHTPFLAALYAQSVAPSNPVAARFDGAVVVNGNQSVTGAKSAIVPHPDGVMRTLYCQESPEAWFEDFGRGQLVNGVARIQVDPDFAAVVQGEYSVFPAPEGNCNGIYVGPKTASSFEVRELNGGKSTLPFVYRIVAKRKDVPAPRFARVDPKLTGRDKAMDLIPGVGLPHISNRPGANAGGANGHATP